MFVLYLFNGETLEVPTAHKNCSWPKIVSLTWPRVSFASSKPMLKMHLSFLYCMEAKIWHKYCLLLVNMF